MSDALQQFVGKDCLITMIANVNGLGLGKNIVAGTVRSVDEHWMRVGNDNVLLNVNAIIQICEHPVNKQGKKKIVI